MSVRPIFSGVAVTVKVAHWPLAKVWVLSGSVMLLIEASFGSRNHRAPVGISGGDCSTDPMSS